MPRRVHPHQNTAVAQTARRYVANFGSALVCLPLFYYKTQDAETRELAHQLVQEYMDTICSSQRVVSEKMWIKLKNMFYTNAFFFIQPEDSKHLIEYLKTLNELVSYPFQGGSHALNRYPFKDDSTQPQVVAGVREIMNLYQQSSLTTNLITRFSKAYSIEWLCHFGDVQTDSITIPFSSIKEWTSSIIALQNKCSIPAVSNVIIHTACLALRLVQMDSKRIPASRWSAALKELGVEESLHPVLINTLMILQDDIREWGLQHESVATSPERLEQAKKVTLEDMKINLNVEPEETESNSKSSSSKRALIHLKGDMISSLVVPGAKSGKYHKMFLLCHSLLPFMALSVYLSRLGTSKIVWTTREILSTPSRQALPSDILHPSSTSDEGEGGTKYGPQVEYLIQNCNWEKKNRNGAPAYNRKGDFDFLFYQVTVCRDPSDESCDFPAQVANTITPPTTSEINQYYKATYDFYVNHFDALSMETVLSGNMDMEDIPQSLTSISPPSSRSMKSKHKKVRRTPKSVASKTKTKVSPSTSKSKSSRRNKRYEDDSESSMSDKSDTDESENDYHEMSENSEEESDNSKEEEEEKEDPSYKEQKRSKKKSASKLSSQRNDKLNTLMGSSSFDIPTLLYPSGGFFDPNLFPSFNYNMPSFSSSSASPNLMNLTFTEINDAVLKASNTSSSSSSFSVIPQASPSFGSISPSTLLQPVFSALELGEPATTQSSSSLSLSMIHPLIPEKKDVPIRTLPIQMIQLATPDSLHVEYAYSKNWTVHPASITSTGLSLLRELSGMKKPSSSSPLYARQHSLHSPQACCLQLKWGRLYVQVSDLQHQFKMDRTYIDHYHKSIQVALNKSISKTVQSIHGESIKDSILQLAYSDILSFGMSWHFQQTKGSRYDLEITEFVDKPSEFLISENPFIVKTPQENQEGILTPFWFSLNSMDNSTPFSLASMDRLNKFLSFHLFLCIIFQCEWKDSDNAFFINMNPKKGLTESFVKFYYPHVQCLPRTTLSLSSEGFQSFMVRTYGPLLDKFIPQEKRKFFITELHVQTSNFVRSFRTHYIASASDYEFEPVLEKEKGSSIDFQMSLISKAFTSSSISM